MKELIETKLVNFGWDEYRSEIAPYLPTDKTPITESEWDDKVLEVWGTVANWLNESLEVADKPIDRKELAHHLEELERKVSENKIRKNSLG